MREHKDVVVIGGGHAGLAMSSALQRRGREHVVLERRRIGERWRTERWESLRFQFPNWTLQLPGYSFRGNDPDRFAHYSEILRVVEDYAVSMGVPVREHTEALAITGRGAGEGFEVSLAEGSIHTQRVVIATGPFQRPRIPQLARDLPPSALQIDPTHYRSPRRCRQAPCSWWAAAPQAARSPTNCYMPGAACTCR
ncbi:NAD(P)-binding domain-containing protein [Arthrobacter globiformis]|uniref:NAD(P)-binding domain-containing protein n=1 Tax=Arthrobacter globiformis TaxID=1665 RepID=UPI0027D858A9|nr:NAD(P)-binding domain-containing protein [Arthrobacter globiformis]